jgi:hypothetical protein
VHATTAIAPAPAAARRRRVAQPNPLQRLDATVEHAIAADMRLLYGMLVPMLFVCGVILLLVLNPSEWLVAAAVAAELLCLTLIVTKILAMLAETDTPDPAGISPGQA